MAKELILHAKVVEQCQTAWQSASEQMPPKIKLSCRSVQAMATRIHQDKTASWPNTTYDF